MRFVIGIEIITKCIFRLVEDDCQMGRLLLRLHVAEELPQHVAEAEHSVDLQPVRLAGERRQRVIGAENVRRTINEQDVIAPLEWSKDGF